MAIVLALLSSALWGTSDFLGGMLSRRHPPVVIVMWVQVIGVVAIGTVALATGEWRQIPDVLWPSILAASAGFVGFALFYRALATGTMGVVAPITALGGVVPVSVGLIQGDDPSALQGVGVVIALLGVVLASGPELRGGSGWRPVALAAGAGLCFGGTLVFIAEGAQTSTQATLTLMRIIGGALGVLAVLALRRPWRMARSEWPALVTAGVFEVSANLAYSIASTVGLLTIVAVAGSLYPVVTVVLAGVVLHERLVRIQQVGVLLALSGIALIAAG